MQNDFKAIQAIAQTQTGANHIGNVLKKTDDLLRNLDAPQLTDLIGDLLFFVGHPENAEELSKEDFVNLMSNSLSLVSMITDLRSQFADYVKHAKEVNHE